VNTNDSFSFEYLVGSFPEANIVARINSEQGKLGSDVSVSNVHYADSRKLRQNNSHSIQIDVGYRDWKTQRETVLLTANVAIVVNKR
jgi:hypothetical protein